MELITYDFSAKGITIFVNHFVGILSGNPLTHILCQSKLQWSVD